jgi:hypothetical protein
MSKKKKVTPFSKLARQKKKVIKKFHSIGE